MQNTTASQRYIISPKSRAKNCAPKVVLALVLTIAFALACLAAPAYAQARSYTMPKVNITANAQSDGSLNVIEQRTFDFDGNFTAVWWNMNPLPDNAEFVVNAVQIGRVDAKDDGTETQLQDIPEVDFKTQWRDEGGPGTTAYSVDTFQNTAYVFFNETDTKITVQIDYTIENGVQAYRDCAELYWKYVASQWAVDSEDVTCTITLPVPVDASPVLGEDVYAWGHGPLSGSFAFNDAGSAVTYHVDKVNAGQYAEARVLFPPEWLTNMSTEAASAHGSEYRLNDILKDEATWADEANFQRQFSLIFMLILAAVSIALIAWALVMFLRHGKEYKPTFTDEYWRDVPHKGVHPAVITRLWHWGSADNDEFAVTLMNLANQGAISIFSGEYEQPGLFGSKKVEDYYIVRNDAQVKQLTNEIDQQAISFLFNKVGGRQPSVWLSSITQWGKSNPQAFKDELARWQGKVTRAYSKMDYFELKGENMQSTVALVSGLCVAAALVLAYFMGNLIPIMFLGPTAVVLFVFSNFMTRRTQAGADDAARCTALKRWLRDFTALKDRPITDVKVWGELMVYAYMFGISEQVLEKLRASQPEMFAETDTYTAAHPGFVPWYAMYAMGAGTATGSPFASAFDTVMSNTSGMVEAATSAGSGNWSSGGGFGGGFSGGGGGGFGGGGGAR